MIGLHFLSSNLASIEADCDRIWRAVSWTGFLHLKNYRFYLLADRHSKDNLRVPPITLWQIVKMQQTQYYSQSCHVPMQAA